MEKYNRLTVLKEVEGIVYSSKNYKRVLAICDCGVEKEYTLKDLKRGRTKSCGCLQRENTKEVQEQYNSWTVVSKVKADKRSYLCKCVCGVQRVVLFKSLDKGVSKSCGCHRGISAEETVKKEKTTPTDNNNEQWKISKNYPQYYISTLGRLFHISCELYIKAKKNHKGIKVLEEMYTTFTGDYDKNTTSIFCARRYL